MHILATMVITATSKEEGREFESHLKVQCFHLLPVSSELSTEFYVWLISSSELCVGVSMNYSLYLSTVYVRLCHKLMTFWGRNTALVLRQQSG